MDGAQKELIIRDNAVNTAAKIKELAAEYDISEVDIEDYLGKILKMVTENNRIEIEDDMSDIYEILDEVVSDQHYANEFIGNDQPDNNPNEKPRTANESIEYFVKEKYDQAYEIADTDYYDEELEADQKLQNDLDDVFAVAKEESDELNEAIANELSELDRDERKF